MMSSFFAKAIPADGVARIYRQVDGTYLTLQQCGDEYLSFFITEDGFVVCEDDNDAWYYAIYLGDRLTKSKTLAHAPNNRNIFERDYLLSRKKMCYDSKLIDRMRVEHNQLMNACNARRTAKKISGIPASFVGSKRGLIILVEFANQKMSSFTAGNDFHRMFNMSGYNENCHRGSVHDYFYDQSFGQFDLFFDVVGPVTLSRNYGYYGSDSMSGRHDINVKDMVREACEIVDSCVNFQDYDWNNDGLVDQVFLIYAGYGQATGGTSNTIWPHESYVSEGPVLDGVKISQYACSNELYGNNDSPRMVMGIGTACHEFSHCLGLPDLYDTDYSGAFGMNCWDVMDAGGYSGPNGVGEVPVGYSAFERYYVGWMNLDEIHCPENCLLPPLNDTPKAYIIRNDGDENEFLVLENHQSDKWFRYIGTNTDMHGMMVTHIDYDAIIWIKNLVNGSQKHQRESIIPADNSYGYYDENNKRYNVSVSEYRGDLYPGLQNVTRISSTTHTNCGGTWYNHNSMNNTSFLMTIDNINEVNGIITFTVGANISSPSGLVAELISDNEIKVKWNAESEAESYTLEITKMWPMLPIRTEIEIIDNIVENWVIVPNNFYSQCGFRVKSKNLFVSSEWSDFVSVDNLIDGTKNVGIATEKVLHFYDIKGNIIDSPLFHGIYIEKSGSLLKKYIK